MLVTVVHTWAVHMCWMFIQDKLEALVRSSQAFQENPTEMEALWGSSSCLIYSLEDRQKQLGLGNKVGSDIIHIHTIFWGDIILYDIN